MVRIADFRSVDAGPTPAGTTFLLGGYTVGIAGDTVNVVFFKFGWFDSITSHFFNMIWYTNWHK